MDVIVIGGSDAALCAGLAAVEQGSSVLVVERSTRAMRGGNTRRVRNLRDAHAQRDNFVAGPYEPDEFLEDIRGVTGDEGDPLLTQRLVVAVGPRGPERLTRHPYDQRLLA